VSKWREKKGGRTTKVRPIKCKARKPPEKQSSGGYHQKNGEIGLKNKENSNAHVGLNRIKAKKEAGDKRCGPRYEVRRNVKDLIGPER